MESLFPSLLFLGPYFTPFLLRVGVALLFLHEAHTLQKGDTHSKVRAAWALVLALCLGAGFITQLAAIAGIVYAVVAVVTKAPHSHLKTKTTALLAVVILLSLIISGAGAFAFDLPY